MPNVTVVELPFAAKRDYSRNIEAQFDSCLFLSIKRTQLFVIYFRMFRGHNIIYGGIIYAIFCTRMDFTKFFVMSIDFAEIKNIENMSIGMIYKMH